MKQQLETYWSTRYQNQSTGWDIGEVSEPIRQYVDQLADKSMSILIPGAGNAYEAEYLFRSGFVNTHIVDIAQEPLDNFWARLPEFPSEQIIHGDFFDLLGQYDRIIEQTFFCSFPPVEGFRASYVRKMHELIKPGGKLVGLWFDFPLTGDMEKRPFGGSREEYLELMSAHFEMQVLERAHNSIDPRAGKELFGMFKKP